MNAARNDIGRERRLSVLIVEDEVLIALDIKAMVEENGYQVMGPATSISSAIQRLETERPDITLLDANLRGEAATPIAERLGELGIPFIMCTAYSSFAFDQKASFEDAPHLIKPISKESLLRAIEDVLA